MERWILARLRHHTFFSLTELNAAIGERLEALNQRPFKKLPGSRRTLFEQLDRPAMKPLPAEPYVYAQWSKARVHIDYHVEVDAHYYSVPYPLVKQELHVRLSQGTVELFYRGQRVASHLRSHQSGRHTTLTEHMPRAHQAYAQWTPQRLIHWAEKTGPATAEVVATILASRAHVQQSFRSCLGIMRLGKSDGDDRLEAACQRAHRLQAYACALTHSACRQGFTARYVRLPKLFRELAIAKGDGRYSKLIKDMTRVELLVLDDLGLSNLNDDQRRDLLEIFEERYEQRSTIVTSQFPIEDWHELIGDPTLADAILDRLVHNAYKKGRIAQKTTQDID